ncbi:MAG TPA: thiolase family protein [Candidatus Acidoferrales bacterium]|jgi:acetyl-CoA C-acetyltransferase|nr:thiolase family protein [Candidatus Acidoferrales bacterium]
MAKNQGVYILSAVRTPIGKFGGMLADFTQPDLGTIAVRAALERAFGEPLPAEREPGAFDYAPLDGGTASEWLARGGGRETLRADETGPQNGGGQLPWHVDELIFGNARPAGVGPNPARQIAWRAGLGDDVPGFTVNMACASGLRTVMLGWQEILTGGADIVVSGGAESMSRVPYLVEGRWGFRLGNQPLIDGMYRDGFLCPISKMIMGETAELLAKQYKIPRDEQDAFALESHQRAARASAECHFQEEIVPITIVDKKNNTTVLLKDEHVRPDVTLEALAKLPPVFSKTGTITAGNSSGITDGAAAVVLASERKVRELNLKPIARIVGATVAAVDARVMGIGPVPAIRKLAERTGTRLADYDAIELNEAFAAQVLACDRDLHFDRARLNPNGGAIALGHPIACTGSRILTTLIHEIRRPHPAGAAPRAGRRGLATLCVSGGMGVAVEIETV